jgi:hypothetical protein
MNGLKNDEDLKIRNKRTCHFSAIDIVEKYTRGPESS